MRAKQRRTRVLAAFAVVALSALVPGPVTAVSTTSDPGIPGVSQLITMFAPGAETSPSREVAEPRVQHQARAPAHTTAAEPTTAPRRDTVAPEAKDDADPATFVREVDVLHVTNTTTPAEELPPPSSGPCPTPTTCKSHVVRPVAFKTDESGHVTIPWKFNDEGRRNLRAPTGLLESAMRWGTTEWSRWNSNVAFQYAGTTDATFGADGKDGSCADGTNTVTWHQFDPSIIAAVVTCTDPAGKTIRDADLALNVTQHWEDIGAEPDSRHTFDISSIVTHELGHWLSLLDLYDGDAIAQTMMGNAVYGETGKRTLALGDVIGLQTVYPCGSGDSCPRKGITDD